VSLSLCSHGEIRSSVGRSGAENGREQWEVIIDGTEQPVAKRLIPNAGLPLMVLMITVSAMSVR